MDLIKIAEEAFATGKQHPSFKAGDTITVAYRILARKLEFRKKELISKIYHSYIKKEYSQEENTPFLIYIPFTTIFYIIMNKQT